MTTHVFVGPTLSVAMVKLEVEDAVVHPPVAHGDLLREKWSPGDVAVLVDGYFHHAAAVRHKEILSLLSDGVHVVGCASMGALRAAELHPYGMAGAGVVYELFRDGVLVADDEVAVAHTADPEFRALSEPLVNIRHVMAAAQAHGVVSQDVATSVVTTASTMHYPRRTWRAIEEEECRRRPGLRADFRRVSRFRDARPDLADIKATDALTTLRELPDILARTPVGPPAWATYPDWRNTPLYIWLASFFGEKVGGVWVSSADVLSFQQIYCQDFPRRWRQFALGRIGAGKAPQQIPDRALKYWLTPTERAALSSVEQVRTVLTRSYRPPRSIFDLVEEFPDLLADPEARRAVAESTAVNAEVARWPDQRGLDRLRLTALREHLTATWGVDPGNPGAVDAAARDRGLGTADEAADLARRFFLRSYLRSLPSGGGRGPG